MDWGEIIQDQHSYSEALFRQAAQFSWLLQMSSEKDLMWLVKIPISGKHQNWVACANTAWDAWWTASEILPWESELECFPMCFTYTILAGKVTPSLTGCRHVVSTKPLRHFLQRSIATAPGLSIETNFCCSHLPQNQWKRGHSRLNANTQTNRQGACISSHGEDTTTCDMHSAQVIRLMGIFLKHC